MILQSICMYIYIYIFTYRYINTLYIFILTLASARHPYLTRTILAFYIHINIYVLYNTRKYREVCACTDTCIYYTKFIML